MKHWNGRNQVIRKLQGKKDFIGFKKELWICLKGIVLGGILIVLFYQSVLGCFVLLPCLPVYYKREKRRYQQKEKEHLKKEFQQMIQLIVRGLEIGYSLEHCVENAANEYEKMIEKGSSPMLIYLNQFLKKMQMNVPIQKIFEQFALESELEEAESFAQIIETARKTGGNLPDILRRTIDSMNEKEQVREEIVTMMSAKRMEQKVMTAMPIGILAYMRITSGDYMEPLYHNISGFLVATIGLILIGVSMIWAEKMIAIDI